MRFFKKPCFVSEPFSSPCGYCMKNLMFTYLVLIIVRNYIFYAEVTSIVYIIVFWDYFLMDGETETFLRVYVLYWFYVTKD